MEIKEKIKKNLLISYLHIVIPLILLIIIYHPSVSYFLSINMSTSSGYMEGHNYYSGLVYILIWMVVGLFILGLIRYIKKTIYHIKQLNQKQDNPLPWLTFSIKTVVSMGLALVFLFILSLLLVLVFSCSATNQREIERKVSDEAVYVVSDTSVIEVSFRYDWRHLSYKQVELPGLPTMISNGKMNYIKGIYVNKRGELVTVKAVCAVDYYGKSRSVDKNTGKEIIKTRGEVVLITHNRDEEVIIREMASIELLSLSRSHYRKIYRWMCQGKNGFVILD